MTIKGNPGFIVLVGRRIFQFRREVKLDTQHLRSKWVNRLDKLFAIATSIANGDVKVQRVGKQRVPVSLKQRQMWAHVAAHIAMVMGNLAKGYDERQLDDDLAELERLVDEIKNQNKTKEAEAGVRGNRQPRDSLAAPTA